MDLFKGLLTRRTVRDFIKGKDVSDAMCTSILNAAMHAPSSRDARPWEFIVVKDKEVHEEIMNIHPFCSHLKDAPLAIITCGDVTAQMSETHWVMDCSAACENILLACHSMKLGACWCGIYPGQQRMKNFSYLLKLPKNIKPLAMIVIGHVAKKPVQPKDRWDNNKIHYERW